MNSFLILPFAGSVYTYVWRDFNVLPVHEGVRAATRHYCNLTRLGLATPDATLFRRFHKNFYTNRPPLRFITLCDMDPWDILFLFEGIRDSKLGISGLSNPGIIWCLRSFGFATQWNFDYFRTGSLNRCFRSGVIELYVSSGKMQETLVMDVMIRLWMTIVRWQWLEMSLL